eukprot:4835856-Ditylum_brightwellii.AAC.1
MPTGAPVKMKKSRGYPVNDSSSPFCVTLFFMPHKLSAIAIAAFLNAMEGINQSYLPQDP